MPGAQPSPTTCAMAASSSTIGVSSARCADAGTCGGGPLAAAGIQFKSTMTNEETLRRLCEKFGVPAGYEPSVPGGGGRACSAPAGAICVYEDALAAGLRVPLHPFYGKALRHYGLAPGQLTPNSWRFMAAFVVLCSDAGVAKPRLAVFRHFFTVCVHCKEDPEGWHFFMPKSNRPLFRITSLQQLRVNQGWKERFFFLSSPAGTWPCPVKWGKPSREAVWEPKLSDKAKEDIQKLRDVQGSACIDLISLLAEHKLAAVLAPAPVKIEENAAVAPVGGSPVKIEENAAGNAAAERTGPAAPMGRSPPVAGCGPGDSITGDQLIGSIDRINGDDWLQTVLKKTADLLQKESSMLRQELSEVKESEAAAKAELAEARRSETAAKAELAEAKHSEETAKADLKNMCLAGVVARAQVNRAEKSEEEAMAELAKAKKSKAKAIAYISKVKKSEAEAKAELGKARKSEAAAMTELDKARKSESVAKAKLVKARKSEEITIAMLASAKAKVQKTGNEYAEDFKRLHSTMMEGLGNAFGTDKNNVAPASNETAVLNQALAIQHHDSTRAHEQSHTQSIKL